MRVFLRSAAPVLAVALFAGTVFAAPHLLHDLTGNWGFAVVTENGTGTPAVTLKQTGEKLTGTYESRMMGSRSIAGTVVGDSVRFTLQASDPEGVSLDFRGVVVTKDSLAGIVDFGGMGSATFSARRQP